MNPKSHTFLLALIFLLVFISSSFVFATESDPDKTKTPCADVKVKTESIEAYLFGVKVQQAIEKEDVDTLFDLIIGELAYGPRKKDISRKSFDTIFTTGWKEAILAEKPSCYPNGSRGFVLGGDLVWYDKTAEGIWSIHSIAGAHITGLSESNEPSWVHGNDLLRPNCFTKKWASGDNYEFYHEHYGGNSAYPDFVRNIGRYMGAKIPLEAVTADWGDKLSLAVELTKCSTPHSSLGKPIKQGNSNFTITIEINDKAVRETCSSDTYECSLESDSYTALRNIPLEACGLLSPHFKDDCVGVRLVRIEPACTGCNSNANIYGIIKDRASKRIYVVPLANLGSYKNALNYVDKLVADLSAMDSEIPSNLTQKKAEQKHPKVIQDKNRAYKVSLKIFETEILAKQFRAGLLKKGLTPNIEQIENKWEVSIGPYPSEKSARQALSSLEVVTNLKTSAEQGNIDTQFDKEAIKRLKLSAERGNVDARDKLSLLLAESREARDYFEGLGNDEFKGGLDAANKENYKEAVRLFRLSAADGNAKAQYNLGYLYQTGQGVRQDYREAFKWFRIASEQGLPQAQGKIGYMYSQGMGIKKSFKAAFKWFKLAAEAGDSYSQYSIGVMYSEGIGVEKNDKESLSWFKLAAKKGNKDAIKLLTSLGVWNSENPDLSAQEYENLEGTLIRDVAIKGLSDNVETHQCGSHFFRLKASGEGSSSHTEYLEVTNSKGDRINTKAGYKIHEVACTDLTGDNKPDLFLQIWHGGNGSNSYSSYVYLLEDQIKLVFEHNYLTRKFFDLNDDGIQEVSSWYPFRYFGGLCGACSPEIERNFCYKKGMYSDCSKHFPDYLNWKIAKGKEQLTIELEDFTRSPKNPTLTSIPRLSVEILAHAILLSNENHELGYLHKLLPAEVFSWLDENKGEVRRVLELPDSKKGSELEVDNFAKNFPNEQKQLAKQYKTGFQTAIGKDKKMSVLHELPFAIRYPHNEPLKGYPDRNNSIDVNYTNIINGMKVSVIWEPRDNPGSSILGEAIIKFTNVEDGKSFTIYNSNFGLSKDSVKELNIEWDDESGRLKFDKKPISLKYLAPPLFEDDLGDAPFFFFDVDFDGRDELIIEGRHQGQRSMSIFKVYVLKGKSLASEDEQITDNEPYLQLDARSSIDVKNKTINIYGSSGACNNYGKTYRFLPSKNDTEKGRYILEEYSLRETGDDGSCNGYIYAVDNKQKLTLISRETLSSSPQVVNPSVDEVELKGIDVIAKLKALAKQGDVESQSVLGYMYVTGEGIQKNYKEAKHWLKQAGEQGNADAQYNLGVMYAEGVGQPRNYRDSLKLYRLAAKQGNSYAQNNIGWMYEVGLGVSQDKEEALKWYRLAASKDDEVARQNISASFLNGQGKPRGYQEPIKHISLKAKGGDSNALHKLGKMHVKGKEVDQDYEVAIKWFLRAAGKGNSDSQYNLGVMYENGMGVDKNDNEALRWFRLSAKDGNEHAVNRLIDLGLWELEGDIKNPAANGAKID